LLPKNIIAAFQNKIAKYLTFYTSVNGSLKLLA